MKICRTCLLEFELSEFYVHKQMKDGHLNICKSCIKSNVMIHRQKNIERIRQYDATRARLSHRKLLAKANIIKYRKNHPNRNSAVCKLNRALKNGKIKKLPCFECGNLKVEAHHASYDLPLAIV